MKKILSIVILLGVAACSTAKPTPPVINYTEDEKKFINQYQTLAKQAQTPVIKASGAYEVKDEWYFPMHQPSYDQTGIASWYGPGFIGSKTASGEVFRSDDFTAAHPSLPIPSIVEVTNLENGKTLNVRVNDRGPFHSERIIDLSKAAAKELGVLRNGTANVRVRLLPKETLDYLQYAGR